MIVCLARESAVTLELALEVSYNEGNYFSPARIHFPSRLSDI
jgi:hypothetical protein